MQGVCWDGGGEFRVCVERVLESAGVCVGRVVESVGVCGRVVVSAACVIGG